MGWVKTALGDWLFSFIRNEGSRGHTQVLSRLPSLRFLVQVCFIAGRFTTQVFAIVYVLM
jgi:hypothetical protein